VRTRGNSRSPPVSQLRGSNRWGLLECDRLRNAPPTARRPPQLAMPCMPGCSTGLAHRCSAPRGSVPRLPCL
jgi:hypothetical protein